MSNENKTQEVCAVWIDWENRIVSFKEAAGFEMHLCASHDDKLLYALEKCANGFRIQ